MSKRSTVRVKCVDFPVVLAVPTGDLRSGLKRFSAQIRARGLRVVKAFTEPGQGAHMLTICGPERSLRSFLVSEAAGDRDFREMMLENIY